METWFLMFVLVMGAIFTLVWFLCKSGTFDHSVPTFYLCADWASKSSAMIFRIIKRRENIIQGFKSQ